MRLHASLRLALFVATLASALLVSRAAAQTWPSHAHDAQHTGISAVSSQPYTTIHWHIKVDLFTYTGDINVHYGSPLVTTANTVIVPVKTGANSFRVEAHSGATGTLIWSRGTNYVAPSTSFLPGMGPVLAGTNLYIPAAGGGVLRRPNPDVAGQPFTSLYFYGIKNYQANPQAYINNVKISTPLTADAAGNVYFGFTVSGSTPLKLKSGIARIAPDGTAIYASAAKASGDPTVTGVATSCAPALSLDGSTLYIAVTSGANNYLLAVKSSTLAGQNRVRLLDPANGQSASLFDSSSATPTVGPDGDVYFGVIENAYPSHNSRGWMLHYDSTLSTTKTPGSFGWDDTASIVAASLVPSYKGTSKYLLMTKYNNYAGIGTGDGKNRIAILDPNATENDPIIPTVQVMKEVITHLAVTPDPSYPQFPGAVREWCINTAAVDPTTKSIIVNNEDGKLYRWDLTTNTLSEKIKLSGGLGEAYTPTVIGPDGTVYAINDQRLNAIGK